MIPNKINSGGFTLVEVMVALSLLAVGLAGAARLTQTGYQQLTATEQYRQATYWAHSHLNTLSAEQDLDFQFQSGRYDERFRWELNFSPVQTSALNAAVMDGATANETDLIKELSPLVNAQRANLSVWFDDDRRSLNFHTLILSSPAEPPLAGRKLVQ